MIRPPIVLVLLATSMAPAYSGEPAGSAKRAPMNPIIFVTQIPIPEDFTTIGSTFGNHRGDMESAGRGGDLYIRYPDETIKNLTVAAGYGNAGHQGAGAIAVRDPHVHWDGNKVLFSMVIGAPDEYEVLDFFWRLYEVTGLGPADTPVVTLVANQPVGANNIQAIYGSDDRIIFSSDRPRGGALHLYPLLDEYEESPTNSGLWSLNPGSGDLFQLNHLPSGAFTPIIDSLGRVIFTRWDHLQRDQQADADDIGGGEYGTFDYADESAGAARLEQRIEIFPEPRDERVDLLAGTNLEGHSFNRFFPWEIHQDGTGEELINHIGRHELVSYFNRVFNDDPNLIEFSDEGSGRLNPNSINNFFHLVEDPTVPLRFVGVDAPEFESHAAGQLVAIEGPANADQMIVSYLTHRDTADITAEGQPPSAEHSGLYRDPLVLVNGELVAVHTSETHADLNEGTIDLPSSRYDFRLKAIVNQGGTWTAGMPLTPVINKSVTYFNPDVLVTYNGPFWQLNPVELVARPRPAMPTGTVPAIEQQVFADEGVTLQELRDYMTQNQLALVVSRNVTTRDAGDRQQPFNLRITDTATQTVAEPGLIYDVSYLQFFQADHVRGLGGVVNPEPGRRVLARTMHDATNPPTTGPEGSVVLGDDGSMAAFVPARRAMSWALTDEVGTPVVRERYWLNFQPGEIRVCASCHGLNTADQIGNPVPVNPPQALRDLLSWWRLMSCTPGSPDIDGSGRVDVLDATLLANAIGTSQPAFDLDCDGVIGPDDIAVLAASWLNTL